MPALVLPAAVTLLKTTLLMGHINLEDQQAPAASQVQGHIRIRDANCKATHSNSCQSQQQCLVLQHELQPNMASLAVRLPKPRKGCSALQMHMRPYHVQYKVDNDITGKC